MKTFSIKFELPIEQIAKYWPSLKAAAELGAEQFEVGLDKVQSASDQSAQEKILWSWCNE